MLKEFDHIDLDKFYNDSVEQSKYQQEVSKSLGNKDFLDKILRSFNHRAGRRLNAWFRELHNANYQTSSNYDKTILQILGLTNISNITKISKYEWDMAKKKYRIQLKNLLHGITNNNWGKLRDESMAIQRLLRGERVGDGLMVHHYQICFCIYSRSWMNY